MRHSLIVLALSLTFAANVWCAVTVILTRHGEASPEGRNPSLTVRGQARAKLLANMLRDIQLDAIYVSDSKRTQQTAQAVADGHHITCEKKTEAVDLATAIHKRSSGAVLIVGHSNTVPQVISLLGGPSYQIGEGEFDNLFILTISQGHVSVVRLRYGNQGPAPVFGESERTSTMQISFVKSGGLSGAMTRVQGTINLKDGQPEINGDSAYHRELALPEIEMLRAGAEPECFPRQRPNSPPSRPEAWAWAIWSTTRSRLRLQRGRRMR